MQKSGSALNAAQFNHGGNWFDKGEDAFQLMYKDRINCGASVSSEHISLQIQILVIGRTTGVAKAQAHTFSCRCFTAQFNDTFQPKKTDPKPDFLKC